ncbi:DUF1850 domain-containing protein [Jeotgalibacillus haloalkalitolerans]|uniref:DUF1850 domain-containing protein n=1 Tax=Jeotgalibacillus haloalkalitolerans TaxID=3104292 RepID=A0ABU5KP76_9BACL|nr:DUF1850 domain-containing protein [Jeotgalibacillus sp. HH7-29]MDZ5712975.1 DUF1850 domain-containing protein [Jeotgalibacillus sp. HH7-29]
MQKKKMIPVLIIVIAGVFFAAVFLPVRQAITFHHQQSGELISYIPVSDQKDFHLSYTHSIHKSEVIDFYEITKENEIRQVALEYEDMAIGMPSNAMYEGEEFVEKDGKYRIEHMNRLFPSINLHTSQVVVSHVFHYHDKDYALDDYIEPGTFITISIKKLTLAELLRGVGMDD